MQRPSYTMSISLTSPEDGICSLLSDPLVVKGLHLSINPPPSPGATKEVAGQQEEHFPACEISKRNY